MPHATVKLRVDGEERSDDGDGRRHGRRLLQGDREDRRPAAAARALRGQGDHRRHRRAGRGVVPGPRGRRAPSTGQGAHTDIIMASALAYVNALNKLEYRQRYQRADAGRRAVSGGGVKAKILVLPGDGIGPEVTAEAVRGARAVCRAAASTSSSPRRAIGGAAIDAHGAALPPAGASSGRSRPTRCCSARSADRSGTTRRATVRPEQALLGLRKGLGLFANLRPVRVVAALVDASTLKPEVARRRRPRGRARAHRRHLLRPAERAAHRSDGREAVDTMPYSRGRGPPRAAGGLRARAPAAQEGHLGRQGEHPRRRRACGARSRTRWRASIPT